jgi:TorA maturation chaperone TorD
MSTISPVTPALPTIATAADLLAHWWSRPVAAEVELWCTCEEVANEVNEMLGSAGSTPIPHPPGLTTAAPLLEEYERLFVGPGEVPCPPYESYWREDVPIHLRRSLMGPCVDDLRHLYGALGLSVAHQTGELPDHLAVELEALAYALLVPDGQKVAHALLADHLRRWAPKLCRTVARATDVSFYRDLATTTGLWLAALQDEKR